MIQLNSRPVPANPIGVRCFIISVPFISGANEEREGRSAQYGELAERNERERLQDKGQDIQVGKHVEPVTILQQDAMAVKALPASLEPSKQSSLAPGLPSSTEQVAFDPKDDKEREASEPTMTMDEENMSAAGAGYWTEEEEDLATKVSLADQRQRARQLQIQDQKSKEEAELRRKRESGSHVAIVGAIAPSRRRRQPKRSIASTVGQEPNQAAEAIEDVAPGQGGMGKAKIPQ